MHSTAPSIRARLIRLIAASILPAFVMAAVFIWRDYTGARDRTYQSALTFAKYIASELDEQLLRREMVIRALSTSPSLDAGDLAAFHREAEAAVHGMVISHVILSDLSGKQLVNTAQPFGTALAGRMDADHLRQLDATGEAVVSPLLPGAVPHQSLVAISVPVVRQGRRLYFLSAEIESGMLSDMLAASPGKPGWSISLVDQRGVIAARNRVRSDYVGTPATDDVRKAVFGRHEGTFEGRMKDAVPVFVAFTHSMKSDWAVAVGVPTKILLQSIRQDIEWLILGIIITFVGSVALAWNVANSIRRAIHGLIAPARALGAGRDVVVPPLGLREADELGAVLVQAQTKMHQAEQRAVRDALTGLGNWDFFAETAELSKAMSDRTGEPFSILYLDLDRFKPVNDTYGHATGDEVLKEVGRRLKLAIRDSDIAVRLGGDEFAVVLPGTTQVSAKIVAHKIVAAVSAPIVLDTPRPIDISCSVGVATYPFSGTSTDAVLSAADNAMYRAKSKEEGVFVAG